MEQKVILREFLFKLDVIAPFIALLFAIIWLVQKKKITSNSILIAIILVQVVLNTTEAYLQFMKINNLRIYHLNCILTHVIFTYYFLNALKQKWIVYTGVTVFLVANLLLGLTITSYEAFPSYPFAISSFILVVYALVLLNKVIELIPTFHILSLKEFWLVAGVLTYFGSSFLIFISYHYFSDVSPKNVSILWQVHNIFLALSCIIFIKAITSRQWLLK